MSTAYKLVVVAYVLVMWALSSRAVGGMVWNYWFHNKETVKLHLLPTYRGISHAVIAGLNVTVLTALLLA